MDLAIEVDYAVVRSVEVDYNSVVEYDLLLAGKVKAVADCPKKAHVGVVRQPEIYFFKINQLIIKCLTQS